MLASLAGAFVVSLIACVVLIRLGTRGVMLDLPNARSLHSAPTPRTGGIAIALGMAPAVAITFAAADLHVRLILAGWLLVFSVSLLDDVRSLPAWLRLAVHVGAGLLVVLSPAYPDTPLSVSMGLLWIVWGTNLFNFMDGMDGLAGMMTVVGGAALGIAFQSAEMLPLALLVAAAASAAAGFLCFNLPPARIFMGDAGSAPLGFLFAATATSAVGYGELPPWLPLLVFLPFVADATFTLLRRIYAREAVWRAHRSHAYQRLVLAGWSAGRVLALEVAAMTCCGLAAVLMQWNQGLGWVALIAGTVLLGPIYWVIMRTHRMTGN